jgi:hypothetical protein
MSRVRTAVETVPVGGVVPDGADFSGPERAELAGLPPRTAAGYLALKRALAALAADVTGRPAPRLCEFVLAHDAQGAPVVAAWPEGLALDPGRVRVSIAHSRATACGAAAYEEAGDE